MVLVVCIAIKTQLDSRKISNKIETKKNRAGGGSQAEASGGKKGFGLLGSLSSYCHLALTSHTGQQKDGEPQGSDKRKTWFSLGKSEASERNPSERNSTNQINLMKKLCGEFREASKLKNKGDREERLKELEKIRGAR